MKNVAIQYFLFNVRVKIKPFKSCRITITRSRTPSAFLTPPPPPPPPVLRTWIYPHPGHKSCGNKDPYFTVPNEKTRQLSGPLTFWFVVVEGGKPLTGYNETTFWQLFYVKIESLDAKGKIFDTLFRIARFVPKTDQSQHRKRNH